MIGVAVWTAVVFEFQFCDGNTDHRGILGPSHVEFHKAAQNTLKRRGFTACRNNEAPGLAIV
jgi:hypothetical protein